MEEIRIKTERELLVEFRNAIAARVIEQRANIVYWKKEIRKLKSNTPAIMQAFEAKKINEEKIPKDIVFLQCIDEMLQQYDLKNTN